MDKWNAKILMTYGLFQLPALILLVVVLVVITRWHALPGWFIASIIAVWIVKDLVLFPFVWRAYDRRRSMHVNTLVGTTGIAQGRLAPTGYVRVRGELWKAIVVGGGPPVENGSVVQIVDIRGLALLVKE